MIVAVAVGPQDTFGSTSRCSSLPAKWNRRTGQYTPSQKQILTSKVSSAVQAPEAATGSLPSPSKSEIPSSHVAWPTCTGCSPPSLRAKSALRSSPNEIATLFSFRSLLSSSYVFFDHCSALGDEGCPFGRGRDKAASLPDNSP